MAGLLGGPALAAPPAGLPPQPPKEVSGITVYAQTEAPKVAVTYPAAGQTLSAGVLILTVTFDQKMLGSGYDIRQAAGGEMPECLKTPRLLDDGKTFVPSLHDRPAQDLRDSFQRNPQGGFTNIAEHRAEASTLAFTTTDADGPRSIPEAMKTQKPAAGGHADPDGSGCRRQDRRRERRPAAASIGPGGGDHLAGERPASYISGTLRRTSMTKLRSRIGAALGVALALGMLMAEPAEARRGRQLRQPRDQTYSQPRQTQTAPGYVPPVQRSMTAPGAAQPGNPGAFAPRPGQPGFVPNAQPNRFGGFGGGLIGAWWPAA